MNAYHILNGDCLADQLSQTKINQNYIVCRECLIDGNLYADNIADFWNVRAHFIAKSYPVSTKDYFIKTVNEFEKLDNLPENSNICLWFENDLFCQANMWFVISYLANYPTFNIFRVFPIIENKKNTWKGFSIANANKLEKAYRSKVAFTSKDIELGKDLWAAYQKGDFDKLKQLSRIKSDCFAFLEEVCQAHIDRFPMDGTLGRPDKVVKEILDNFSTEFEDVFSEFSNREGIYGFGDLQLKNIYKKQLSSQKKE